MDRKQTAFVVVDRDWFDLAMHGLITTEKSHSGASAHVMVGPIKDLHDPRGLWLNRIESATLFEKENGSPAVMDVLIPWQYVLAVGVVDEATPLKPGFSGATVLKSVS